MYWRLVRLLHWADVDVGDFRRARQAQGVRHHFRHVFGLPQQFRFGGAAFLGEELFHARRGGAAGENAHNTDAVGVDLIAQTVGGRAKSVLRRERTARRSRERAARRKN